MKRILVVEDEPPITEVVQFALEKAGYAVTAARTLEQARRAYDHRGADLVILDLGLPDGDGMDLCRRLRERGGVPILILTARDEEVDRVLGLESGADDYVVKPFSPRELVARVKTILRRADPAPTDGDHDPLVLGRVLLRLAEHRVLLDDAEIRLTPTEFQLLRTLMRTPSRVFPRDLLLDRAYGDDAFITERTIDSHIKGIRRKFAAVEAGADPVETVFGVGYRARVLA